MMDIFDMRNYTFVLEIIFGMTATPVNMYLIFRQRILLEIVSHEPHSAVNFPSDYDTEQIEVAINLRNLMMNDVWCAMDDLTLLFLEKSGKKEIQNYFYY